MVPVQSPMRMRASSVSAIQETKENVANVRFVRFNILDLQNMQFYVLASVLLQVVNRVDAS